MGTETINPEHLERLCRDFGVGVNPITEENSEGVLNKNYLLTTDQGRYFIKSVREKRKSSVPYIAAVEEFFFRRGIPAVCMRRTQDGSAFAEYDSSVYTVYPFLESVRTHKYDRTDFRTMGEMLGRIHLAGSVNIPPTLSQKLFDEKSPEMVVEKLRHHRSSIREKRTLDSTDIAFLDYIELKLNMLARAAHIESLPMDTLVHGDYHTRNLLLNPKREIIGICDWEQASMNARSYELARSVLYVCFNGESDDDQSHVYDTQKAIEPAHAFIAGYSSIYPISNEELVAGMKLRWKKLVYSFWIEEQYYASGDARSNKFIAHEMRLIEEFANEALLAALAVS